MVLQTLVTMEETFAGTAWGSGSMSKTFGFCIVGTTRLQRGRTMVWVVLAGVSSFVLVRREASCTELT